MIDPISGAWAHLPQARENARDEVGRLGWSYVQRFASDFTPREVLDLLEALGEQDFSQLRAFAFLGSAQVAALMEELPQLLRRLPQASIPKTRTVREIRGAVQWTATAISQATTGDRSRFVVREQGRSHDLPENRALAFVLQRIRDLSASSAAPVKASLLKAEDALRLPALAGLVWQRDLPALDRQLLRGSRNRRLRELLVPVLGLYDQLYDDDESFLISALGQRIWLPDGDDRLFELWCLFRLVETLVAAGWQVKHMTLLGSLSRRQPTFIMTRAELRIEIAFQTAPKSLVERNRYGATLEAYGLSSGQRRPDIVISMLGKEDRHLIVEVKLTENRDYITDSIYKVFGYLNDFSYGLRHSDETNGVLIVWSGIDEDAESDGSIHIVTARGIRSGRLAEIVDQFAGSHP